MADRKKALQERLWALHAKRERSDVLRALSVEALDITFLDLNESLAFAARFRERDAGPSFPGTTDEFWTRADLTWSSGEPVVLLFNNWQQTGFVKLPYGVLRTCAEALQALAGPDIFFADPTLERGAILDVGETDTLLRFWPAY